MQSVASSRPRLYKQKYILGNEESTVKKCCGVEKTTSTESLWIVAVVDKTNMQGDHQEMMESFKPKAQGTIQTFEKASPNKEKVELQGRPKSFLEQDKEARLAILENNH